MIVVTGATGHLGHHLIEGLLEKVPAAQLAVVVRTPAKAAALAARGVQVRQGDYDQPASLEAALQGADKLMMISASEVGRRIPQHQAIIDAAKKAGVKFIAYTSILHADTAKMELAVEHLATEKALRASGIPCAILRNSWYLENYTEHLAPVLAHGAVFGATKGGKVAAATRADYAAAAVAVLTSEGHAGKIYELGGDQAFTLAEYAAEVARQTKKPIVYTDLPMEAFEGALVGAGLPKVMAHMLADSDVGISRGELDDHSHTLSKLIGRKTQPLAEVLANALKA